MALYRYTAKDKDGKTVAGMLEGASDSEVAEYLHGSGLVVIAIEAAKTKGRGSKSKKHRVKTDDLVIFSRQLATMIDAGVNLVQALGTLSEQMENAGLKQVVASVKQDIEAGMNFCDALAKHPSVFSELFINMSRAGEASGMLGEVLDRLATYLEKTAALARKIRSSMVYPVIVVSMAILITAFLLINVVPTFKSVFEQLGSTLPLPTQILIGISDALRKYFLFLMVFLFISGFILARYIKTKKGRYRFDALKLKIPVVGPLFRKVAIAKFSRTFSTLVRSGVAVLSALDIVAKTSGNKIIEEAVGNCRNSVHNGEPICLPLSKSGVFPPMVYRMIEIGEKTGELEKMLSKIADFYDEQVDAQVSALTSMIEPMVIAFLGVVIGGIVLSLFLPIFRITEIVAG
ncbi:MAG: type II secretion system F family protein [Candidatus Omnitrophica bacterium]|nr:type II secretion system F family protein [Candidatus Omnitrophota bacterium]